MDIQVQKSQSPKQDECKVINSKILKMPKVKERIFSILSIFYWLYYYICPISPHYSPLPSHPHYPHFSSYPWVIHISSLASPFPKLFLISICLFSTYYLWYLFPVPFLPLSPSHSLVDNSPCDLHFCDSVPILFFCLVCLCVFFFFRFSCW